MRDRSIAFKDRVFKFLRLTLGSILKWRLNLHGNAECLKDLAPPYIVLPNHVNFWDPFMVALYIPYSIFYATSDIHFRSLILRALLKLVGAIPKAKNRSDTETVKQIIRMKNKNGVIGVFPEGRRSWDGVTLELFYSTAKLVKILKVPVVTTIIKGACLSRPRWSSKSRRGRIEIDFTVLLTAKDVESMTVDEIYQSITQALTYNEYDFQRKSMIPFNGSKIAENLELFLFTCPHCKASGKMKSNNNTFFCEECGYNVKYNIFGFFEKKDGHLYFDNTADWNKWQLGLLRENIQKKLAAQENEIILRDEGGLLMLSERRLAPLKSIRIGDATLYRDKLVVSSLLRDPLVFDIDKVKGLNVQLNYKCEFYYMNKIYNLTFPRSKTSGYKWVNAMKILIHELETSNDLKQ